MNRHNRHKLKVKAEFEDEHIGKIKSNKQMPHTDQKKLFTSQFSILNVKNITDLFNLVLKDAIEIFKILFLNKSFFIKPYLYPEGY